MLNSFIRSLDCFFGRGRAPSKETCEAILLVFFMLCFVLGGRYAAHGILSGGLSVETLGSGIQNGHLEYDRERGNVAVVSCSASSRIFDIWNFCRSSWFFPPIKGSWAVFLLREKCCIYHFMCRSFFFSSSQLFCLDF